MHRRPVAFNRTITSTSPAAACMCSCAMPERTTSTVRPIDGRQAAALQPEACTWPTRGIELGMLDPDDDGMLSLDILKKQGVDEQAIAALHKAIDTDGDGVVSKEEWKMAFERAAPALQSAGTAALDLAGVVGLLSIVHMHPADADFAQLRRWNSLVATPRATTSANEPSLVFCGTEQQFGWPVCEVLNEVELSAGCTIPKTEERGISPRQLLALWMHIEASCVKEGWVGAREFTAENAGLPWVEEGKPAVLSTKEKQVWHKIKLTPNLVNLYDCNSYVIKPATIGRRCSYVELVGGKAARQMPKWFVSHWCVLDCPVLLKCNFSECNLRAPKRWGEPVYQFISCLLQHAKDHYYCVADDDAFLDVPYWVHARECAHANSHACAHMHVAMLIHRYVRTPTTSTHWGAMSLLTLHRARFAGRWHLQSAQCR